MTARPTRRQREEARDLVADLLTVLADRPDPSDNEAGLVATVADFAAAEYERGRRAGRSEILRHLDGGGYFNYVAEGIRRRCGEAGGEMSVAFLAGATVGIWATIAAYWLGRRHERRARRGGHAG